jgi:hypothetical protein
VNDDEPENDTEYSGRAGPVYDKSGIRVQTTGLLEVAVDKSLEEVTFWFGSAEVR